MQLAASLTTRKKRYALWVATKLILITTNWIAIEKKKGIIIIIVLL